jgi:N6-adenosine-specific RNA methylase IME4
MSYQVIYADPPWRYEHPISNSRRIENQYDTMSLEAIKQMQIPADNNSVLFMWTTAPKLKEAFEVLESWGFNYRTCLVWDKLSIGMGYWFRNQHELLLVAVKGNFSPPDAKMRISSVFKLKKAEHSEKPAKIRALISSWYPSQTKLELFAREHIEGWDCFGNEVPLTTQKLLFNMSEKK